MGIAYNAMVIAFAHIPLSAQYLIFSSFSGGSLSCSSHSLSALRCLRSSLSVGSRLDCFGFGLGGRTTTRPPCRRNLPYAFHHVLLTNHRPFHSLLKCKKKKGQVVGLCQKDASYSPPALINASHGLMRPPNVRPCCVQIPTIKIPSISILCYLPHLTLYTYAS